MQTNSTDEERRLKIAAIMHSISGLVVFEAIGLQGGPKRSALYILLLSYAIFMLAQLGTSLIYHFEALNNGN